MEQCVLMVGDQVTRPSSCSILRIATATKKRLRRLFLSDVQRMCATLTSVVRLPGYLPMTDRCVRCDICAVGAEVDVRDCPADGSVPDDLDGGSILVGADLQYPLMPGT